MPLLTSIVGAWFLRCQNRARLEILLPKAIQHTVYQVDYRTNVGSNDDWLAHPGGNGRHAEPDDRW